MLCPKHEAQELLTMLGYPPSCHSPEWVATNPLSSEASLAVPHCPVADFQSLHALPDVNCETVTILTSDSCFLVKRHSPLLWVQLQAIARHIACGTATGLRVPSAHWQPVEDLLCLPGRCVATVGDSDFQFFG